MPFKPRKNTSKLSKISSPSRTYSASNTRRITKQMTNTTKKHRIASPAKVRVKAKFSK